VVDTHEAYSGTIDVVLVSSTCANDTLEPGEGCLPGSEGCSFATCQSEIPLKTDVLGVEHEPNDDITQSNLVRLPNPDEFVAPVSINGKVGGGCDDDILELDFSSAQSVATGRVLKVTAGAGCENRPGLIVTIVSDLNGRKIDVANGAEVQGSCPTVTEEMVSNRNYYIKVRAMDDAVPQFDYTLNVELEPVEGI
jgi:hypothetical protein